MVLWNDRNGSENHCDRFFYYWDNQAGRVNTTFARRGNCYVYRISGL